MKYNGKNFKKVLDMHTRWLFHEAKSTPADFSDMDLRGEDLSGLNLSGAKFINTNLRGSTIRNCMFTEADFTHALLDDAKFVMCVCNSAVFNFASMRRIEFTGTFLNTAYMIQANMCDSKFVDCEADAVLFVRSLLKESMFKNTHLNVASFTEANLEDSTIINTSFAEAEIKHACFDGIRGDLHIPLACPETGSFIGWKKCWGFTENKDTFKRKGREYIVKLLIPEDAKRSSATGRKCRCSEAKVLEIQDASGHVVDVDEVYSFRKGRSFIYKVGKIVKPEDKFDGNRWMECASGIHFFITRKEAVEYDI